MHAPENRRINWRTLRAIAIAALLIRAASADSLPGYTAQSSAREVSIEARYKLIPTPEMTQRQHRLFTADPHPAGSERNNYLARYIDTLGRKQDLGKLDLGSMRRAIDEFEAAGRTFDGIQATALASGSVEPLLADQVNRGVMGVERNFLDPNGIPGRPWYKHLVYACRQTYAHLELPGLTEAAEAGDWPLAQQQAARLEAALRVNTALVLQMAQMLGCGGGIHSSDAAVCAGKPSERRISSRRQPGRRRGTQGLRFHYAQLVDVNGAGRLDVLCLDEATFPKKLHDTRTLPWKKISEARDCARCDALRPIDCGS